MRQKNPGYLFVIGGPGSSGSSTISKRFSEYFNIPRVYGGGLLREKAKEAGFDSFEKFLEYYVSENQLHLDEEIDSELLSAAQKRNVVIESKVFAAIATSKGIDCTAKIWLNADIHIRTKRRIQREGSQGFFKDFFRYISIRRGLKKRYSIDSKKYWDLYRIHYSKPELYNDLVLDTSSLNEEETFKLILDFLRNGGYIKQ